MKKCFLFCLAVLISGGVHAQSAWLSVTDTIAGEATGFRASGLLEDETVRLTLTRPDETEISLLKKSNGAGVIDQFINSLHLHQAGDYKLSLEREAFGMSAQSHFRVIPGEVSSFKSTIVITEASAPADGQTQIAFDVRARDAFGNALPGKVVQLISSRNQDVLTDKLVTDGTGRVQGQILSTEPGVSVISAIIGEQVLFEKLEVIFYLDASLPFGVGSSGTGGIGDLLKAQLFESGQVQQATSFVVEEIANTVQTDQHLSVRVVAKDVGGNVVQNYTGTVRFSSSDDRAQLPSDYTFTLADQGQHTFYLAVTFASLGGQTLGVHDVNDFKVSGEKNLQVISGGTPINVPSEDAPIKILTPKAGSYQVLRTTITGKATACTAINLVDGPTVLIEGLATDAIGNFVYQTPTLGEGTHEFQALCSGDESVASGKVKIVVDRSAPTDFRFHFSPGEVVEPGANFEFRLSASEPLSSAQCNFAGGIHDLSPGFNGQFQGSLYAPSTCGDYPVVCTAMDVLGNKNQEPKGTVIRVCKPGEADGQINYFPEDGLGEGENQPPSPPTNLRVESGIDRVTLFWSPAQDDRGIDHYRVEFSCLNLASIFEGEDGLIFDKINETPDDRTQWYVTPMRDDEKCFFRVVAIDTDSEESGPSEVVPGVTLGAPDDLLNTPDLDDGGGNDGDDNNNNYDSNDGAGSEPELEKSGAGYTTWMLLLVAFCFGSGMVLITRAKE